MASCGLTISHHQEMFKLLPKTVPKNVTNFKNLMYLNKDVLYVWNKLESCLLVLNVRNVDNEDRHFHRTFIPAAKSPISKKSSSFNLPFSVNSIKMNAPNSLCAVVGVEGVAILETPENWENNNTQGGKPSIFCDCSLVDWQYFSVNNCTVQQVHWHPSPELSDRLFVLTSSNELRIYDVTSASCIKLFSVWPILGGTFSSSSLSSRNCAVDFDFAPPVLENVAEENTELSELLWPLLVLFKNGDVFTVNHVSSMKTRQTFPEVSGPLKIYASGEEHNTTKACSLIVLPCVPPFVVIAENSGIISHYLYMSESTDTQSEDLQTTEKIQNLPTAALYMLESVELKESSNTGLSELRQVYLFKDPMLNSRYFCSHDFGVVVINIPLVSELSVFAETDDNCSDSALPSLDHSSNCEYLVHTRDSTVLKHQPVLGLAVIDSTLVAFCGKKVLLLPLKSSEINVSPFKEIEPVKKPSKPSFDEVISNLLESLPRLLPKLHGNLKPSPQECLKYVAEITNLLKQKSIPCFEMVQDVIQKRACILRNMKMKQVQKLAELDEEKVALYTTAKELFNKCKNASDSQKSLSKRTKEALKLVSTLGGLAMKRSSTESQTLPYKMESPPAKRLKSDSIEENNQTANSNRTEELQQNTSTQNRINTNIETEDIVICSVVTSGLKEVPVSTNIENVNEALAPCSDEANLLNENLIISDVATCSDEANRLKENLVSFNMATCSDKTNPLEENLVSSNMATCSDEANLFEENLVSSNGIQKILKPNKGTQNLKKPKGGPATKKIKNTAVKSPASILKKSKGLRDSHESSETSRLSQELDQSESCIDKGNECSIFISGIPPNARNVPLIKDELEAEVGHGKVLSVRIPLNRRTGHPRGYGFVICEDKTVVQKLLSSKILIYGKKIHLEKYKPNGKEEFWPQEIPEESILNMDDGCRVFINKISPFACYEPEIKAALEYEVGYGKVLFVQCPVDRWTGHPKGYAFVTCKNKMTAEKLLDLSYKIRIHGKVVNIEEYRLSSTGNEEPQEVSVGNSPQKIPHESSQKESRQNPEDECSVYISHIPPPGCYGPAIKAALEVEIGCGKVLSVKCPVDRWTGQPKGYAFVDCKYKTAAQKLLDPNLNIRINGQRVKIEPFKSSSVRLKEPLNVSTGNLRPKVSEEVFKNKRLESSNEADISTIEFPCSTEGGSEGSAFLELKRNKASKKAVRVKDQNIGKVVPITPGAVIALNLLWASYPQGVSKVRTCQRHEIETALNEHFSNTRNRISVPSEDLKMYTRVTIFQESDESWQRGIILEKKLDGEREVFDVLLADYGIITSNLSSDNIYHLPEEIVKIPTQAFLIALYGIQPLEVDVDSGACQTDLEPSQGWSEVHLNFMSTAIEKGLKFSFKTKEAVNSVRHGTLYITFEKDEKWNMNEIFVEKKYAIYKHSVIDVCKYLGRNSHHEFVKRCISYSPEKMTNRKEGSQSRGKISTSSVSKVLAHDPNADEICPVESSTDFQIEPESTLLDRNQKLEIGGNKRRTDIRSESRAEDSSDDVRLQDRTGSPFPKRRRGAGHGGFYWAPGMNWRGNNTYRGNRGNRSQARGFMRGNFRNANRGFWSHF